MEELNQWDCCDCDLWEQGRYDGTCIHYINNDCPCGYHEEDCELS